MARLVPDLVTGDLISAEAMVLGVFGPDELAETDEADDADDAAEAGAALEAGDA